MLIYVAGLLACTFTFTVLNSPYSFTVVVVRPRVSVFRLSLTRALGGAAPQVRGYSV